MSRELISKQFSKEQIYVVEIDVPRCKLVHGTSPCTATETGDAKCYNTRSTCNDLANYDDKITTGEILLSVNSSGTFTRSSGSFLTDGFKVGQIISPSGFTNAGNNRQFEILTVTATVITVKNNFGMVTEGSGLRTIKTPNIYTYKFCSERSPQPFNMNNIAPCIDSVGIAPATIDPSAGIGARASADVNFVDFPSSDRNGVDPYLSDRTYDPFDVGLFWQKWRARNANYENISVRILSGYIVNNTFDPLNFEARFYVLSRMTASNGGARITCKDPLQLVSNKKALAPKPSAGKLLSAINSTATSATLDPTGIGNEEYPSSGFVKIRSEVLAFTRSGDTLTLTRAQFNTTATDHSAGDTVQLCLHYDGNQTLDEVQADLCSTYAGIPEIYIPRGQWQNEVDTFLLSNPNRLLTDPTEVNKLISELCEQWPHYLNWNDRSRYIELTALKAPPTSANPITFENSITRLSVSDKPDMQISTVQVFYGQFDPTKKIDEKDNYQVTNARINVDAIERYNSNNSKVIYAPWITTANGAAARRIGQLIGRRFGFTPREINFTLEDKDSDVWLGDVRSIIHPDICDRNGAPLETVFQITQAAENDLYNYVALEYQYDKELNNDDALDVSVVDISVSANNVDLLDEYESVFGVGTADASTVVKFIVYAGVVVGSDSQANPALTTGAWPAGATVTLQVNTGAVLCGYAGAGSSSVSVAGGDGGDAISLGYDLELINNGIVGGGGGGGGASAQNNYLAAGGGGAGVAGGISGTSDATGATSYIQEQDGTTTAGGQGATIEYETGGEVFVILGGNGGNLGQAGDAGSGSLQTSAGGAAGKAVDLNGFTLTQTVSGTIQGAIS